MDYINYAEIGLILVRTVSGIVMLFLIFDIFKNVYELISLILRASSDRTIDEEELKQIQAEMRDVMSGLNRFLRVMVMAIAIFDGNKDIIKDFESE